MAVFGRQSRRADNDLPRCSPRRSLQRTCCNSAVQVDHVDQPTQLGSRSSHVRERSTRLESRRTVKPDHGVRTRVPGCCHVIGCYAKGGGQTVNRAWERVVCVRMCWIHVRRCTGFFFFFFFFFFFYKAILLLFSQTFKT